MQTRIKQIGLSLGVAAIVAVGYLGASGQYVPPVNRANVVATSAPCSTGERPESDGNGGWQCRAAGGNDYRSTHLEWNDEWLFSSCGGNQQQCGSIFTENVAGTSAAIASAGSTSRPGILELRTGTTTTGSSALITRSDGIDFGSYTQLVFEFTGGAAVLSTGTDEYSFYAGFGDSGGAAVNQTDGCGFLYDRGNVATNGANSGNANKWECYCASNGLRSVYLMDGTTVSDESFTTVNQTIGAYAIPNTNIHDFKLVITVTAGVPTRAEFYVDRVKSCNINTNLPSGASRRTAITLQLVKSAGTTQTGFDIDRTRVALDLAAGRAL